VDSGVIKVKVTLHSYLAEYLPADMKGETLLDLEEGTTIQNVTQQLGLPGTVAFAVNETIERNSVRELKNGDHLRYLRPGAGG
jgi:sulfur carrier protein ThiS